MHNQEFLNEYFSKVWKNSIDNYIYSGPSILDKISNKDSVIDIGCGCNYFKGKIPKLIGIDPVDQGADVITTIENFTTDLKFDVALCLGSINFGSEEIITTQIEKIVSLLQPQSRIFWRLNPGQKDHGNVECQEVNFFPWTFEKLNVYAKKYGYSQTNCAIDTDGRVIRLYAEWIR